MLTGERHAYVYMGRKWKKLTKVYRSPFPSLLLSPFPSQNAFDQWFRLFWITFSRCFNLKWIFPCIFRFCIQWKGFYSHTHIVLMQVCFVSHFFEYKENMTVGHITLLLGNKARNLWICLHSMDNQYSFLQEGPHRCRTCKGSWYLLVSFSQKAWTKVPLCI